MSQPGVVNPLQITRQDAAIVGSLIESRTVGRTLTGTAFELLPALGNKLVVAAKRRRRTQEEYVTLWAVKRPEAVTGFHYLVLFKHPDAEGFLANGEAPAVHAVTIALAMAIGAHKGASKLDREAVERRLQVWQQPPTSEQDPEAPDERWVRRLKRRVAADDALRGTSVRPIPAFLLGLLAPIGNSR